MPYVPQKNRNEYDELLDRLIERLRCSSKISGDANYCISRLVAGSFEPTTGWNYESGSNVVKTFECAKLEFIRRILNNVEDGAISRNGDIKEYI